MDAHRYQFASEMSLDSPFTLYRSRSFDFNLTSGNTAPLYEAVDNPQDGKVNSRESQNKANEEPTLILTNSRSLQSLDRSPDLTQNRLLNINKADYCMLDDESHDYSTSTQIKMQTNPHPFQNNLCSPKVHSGLLRFHGFHKKYHLNPLHSSLFTKPPNNDVKIIKESIHHSHPKFTSSPIKMSAKQLLNTLVSHDDNPKTNALSDSFNCSPKKNISLASCPSPFPSKNRARKSNHRVPLFTPTYITQNSISHKLESTPKTRTRSQRGGDEYVFNTSQNTALQSPCPPTQKGKARVTELKSEMGNMKKNKSKGKNISNISFGAHQKQYQQYKLKQEEEKALKQLQEGLLLKNHLESITSHSSNVTTANTVNIKISWKDACSQWGLAWRQFAYSL